MAVGNYYDGFGYSRTLTEQWDGRHWAVEPSADGSFFDFLLGVSCVSPTFCVAVGGYQVGSTQLTLAEIWDGSTWSLSATKNDASFDSNILRGVSCVSTTTCVAVGEKGTNSRSTLIEAFASATWTIVGSPNRPTDTGDTLQAVSCTSATSCVAVGFPFENLTSGSLIETLSGTKWSLVKSANAAHLSNALYGVTCTSAAWCVAVGTSYPPNGGAPQTLNETWDGSTWTLASAPTPSGRFEAVSCINQSSCVAVGDQSNGQATLVSTWDGTSWSTTPSPNRRGSNNLLGVSCTTEPACVAVGVTLNTPIWRTLALSTGEGDAPTAPTAVVAEAGSASASVSWNPPTASPTPVRAYVVTAEPGGQQVSVPAPTSSTTITGLTNGQSYTFTVAARNEYGSSTPSSPSNAVEPVAGPPVEFPSTQLLHPASLGATAVPVHESWATDTNPNGVCGYDLQQSINGGPYNEISLSTPTDTFVDIALDPVKTYTFRLDVTDCASGTSGWGVEKSVTVNAWQESSSLLTLYGAWTSVAVPGAYGGSISRTTDSNAAVSATFYATSIALVAEKGPAYGVARIFIDDEPTATIDLHGAAAREAVVVYAHSWSGQKYHTIRIFVGTGGTHTGIDIDALLVLHR